MTGPGHPDDDRLLELAYGELSGPEVSALHRHVDGCPRCRGVLEGIAEVRTAVRRVPPEPAPERGLESLLAYGEQAAAQARTHRSKVQWLGLLTLATAAGLAWVFLPGRQERAPTASEAIARSDRPAPPAQGDRAAEKPAEVAAADKADGRAKLEKELQEKDADEKQASGVAGVMKEQRPQGQIQGASRDDRETARRAGAVAAAPVSSPPTDALERAKSPRPEAKKKAESATDEAELRARSPAAPAKVASATPQAAAPASSAPKEVSTTGGDLAKGSAAGRADVGSSSSVAGLVGGLGSVGGGPAASSNVSKPFSDRAARETRLAEVRRSAATATGDARKALLLEQCRLEAGLDLRAAAVGTCSQVSREFPGTTEALQAVEVARGFSVQPAVPER